MRETRGRDKVFPLGAIFPLLFSENGRLTVGGESFRYRGEFLSPCFLRLTVSPLYRVNHLSKFRGKSGKKMARIVKKFSGVCDLERSK